MASIVSRLQGANEELRKALSEAQTTAQEALKENERKTMTIDRLNAKIKEISDRYSASYDSSNRTKDFIECFVFCVLLLSLRKLYLCVFLSLSPVHG